MNVKVRNGMQEDPKSFRGSPESGSSGFVVLVGFLALGFVSNFVLNQQRKSSRALDAAQLESMATNVGAANISTIAQVKSLLNDKKTGTGDYAPALFPLNYFEAVWKLKKHPFIDSGHVNLSAGANFEIKTLNSGGDDLAQAAQVFSGHASQLSLNTKTQQVNVLRTNFDSTGYRVDSVDVQVFGTQKNGRFTKSLASQARIPVAIPKAHSPILEFRLAGTTNWLRNPSALLPGDYDIRILGSGVVLDALLTINGGTPVHLGSFDSQTGRPRHGAVNILARDELVGQTAAPYPLTSGSLDTSYQIDAKACTMTPIDGTFRIEAALVGVDGTVAPDGRTTVDLKVDGAHGQNMSESDIKGICNDQCPYVENLPLPTDLQTQAGLSGSDANTVSFYRWQQIQAQKGSDFSWSKLYEFNTKFGVFDVKFCENLSPALNAAVADKGRLPSFAELAGAYFHKLEYAYYKAPTCKRQFLFERNSCGCFAEETKILLGDGKTWKSIRELTATDRVWNPVTGKAQGIERMTRGPEKIPMFRLKTKDNELKITRHHPVSTPQGIRRAFELKAGDLIRDGERGWVELLEIHPFKDPGVDPIVWNLVLKGGESFDDHYVNANGIVTGDLYIQTKTMQGQPP